MIKKKDNDINNRTGVGLTEEQIRILEEYSSFLEGFKISIIGAITAPIACENPEPNDCG
jgi:hypothetical protein